MQRIPSLFIAASPLGGRGVFTAEPLPKGALIEICPVLVLAGADRRQLDQTGLHDYYFIWGSEEKKCGIALGYGSLYNHAYSPNAEYRADFPNQTLDFYALRDIGAGEEITVNYNGDPRDRSRIWFVAKGADKPTEP